MAPGTPGEGVDEVLGEIGNVLPSFPEGRQLDGKHIQPVEEVLAEATL